MTDELSRAVSAAVAYQDVTLTQLGALFDQIDLDLQDALERERVVSVGAEDVAAQLDEAHRQLESEGIAGPAAASRDPAVREPASPSRETRYAVPLVPALDDFDELVGLANARLTELGVDLARDPLVQVLPSPKVAESLTSYVERYGETSWDKVDWAAVITAGLVAAILDIVLVRIPQDATFLGRHQTGSPLTKWLQDDERAKLIHERFLEALEGRFAVPYDAATTSATEGRVIGLHPAMHRLMSLGHDPLLGLIVGVADVVQGTGTYVDKFGKLQTVPSSDTGV